MTSRPSRRISIQDTSRITGRSKQRRSKNRSLVLQETPKALKKDISQLHAEDFTPIRPSTMKKIEKKDEPKKNVEKEFRKKIPSFQLIDTPPKAVTRRSTRLSSVQDRHIPRPKAQGRRLGSEILWLVKNKPLMTLYRTHCKEHSQNQEGRCPNQM